MHRPPTDSAVQRPVTRRFAGHAGVLALALALAYACGYKHGPCARDRDCTPGDVCNNNVCVEPPGSCIIDGGCIEGDGCLSDIDCPSDEICLDQACAPSGTCLEDLHCVEGDICVDERCRTPCEVNADCDDTAACVDGLCEELGECVYDEHCQGGQTCEANRCTGEPRDPQPTLCEIQRDCPERTFCFEGYCRRVLECTRHSHCEPNEGCFYRWCWPL